jgi:DNA-binding HxlR family transcriptional regulator
MYPLGLGALPGQNYCEEGISVGYPSSRAISPERETVAASVPEVLRLLSSGAASAILLALGEGPLRTKVLTHRVQGYTPRTIYRYLSKLAELDLVEREATDGATGVVHTLRGESGSGLCSLINRFADASMTRLPSGQIKLEEWSSLGLLADLWEAGVLEELSRGPRSPTELAQGLDVLSYHQLNRRVSRFKASGFFEVSVRGRGQRRRYALTRRTRRAMGLIAGIGRWRQGRHSIEGEDGLTGAEMATVLRACLPLAAARQHAGQGMRIRIGQEAVELCLRVEGDGSLANADGLEQEAAWAAGEVEDWLAVLLDGIPPAEAGGDARAVQDCLAGLHEGLWGPSPF